MGANLRVMHVITGLAVGGAEMMLLKLVSRTQGKGLSHAVVSLDRDGALVPRFRDAGIGVDSLGLSASPAGAAALGTLRGRIREFDPDVIQGWMYHGNLASLAGRWLSRSRAALAWNIRQTLYDLGREKRMTAAVIRAGARMSRRAEAIIYNSVTSATQHERLGYESSRRQLIPNGFDCAAFAPNAEARARTRSTLGLREGDVVVGLVTRFHPMKDHRTFVAAAARVAAAHPEARFLIVGRGVRGHDAGVVDAIEQAGLRERAIVLEERQDVGDIFNATDIACSSSAWGEGFSNAIGEAMACGVPCVVTDVGDSAAIVGDTGIVVPPCDAVAMASAIGELVTAGREQRRTLGEAARERIEKRFSLTDVAARYEALYETLAQQSTRQLASSRLHVEDR
jgi:glycosyltransferase involved in cell wall biosynthesis